MEKVVAMYTSRDHAISECGLEARDAVAARARLRGAARAHTAAWGQLWRRFDIGIEQHGGNGDTRMTLHLHILHLLQTTSIAHASTWTSGVPARGWHGEAYRGHIFWDELFIFPLLNFHIPEITRALLIYRYRRLTEARSRRRPPASAARCTRGRAAATGARKASVVHLNPQSGRWVPDDTFLQRHVNAAIAYNIWQYARSRATSSSCIRYGAEMFLEIARFWASVARFNDELGPLRDPRRGRARRVPHAASRSRRARAGQQRYTNVMAAWILVAGAGAAAVPARRPARGADAAPGASTRPRSARWDAISRKMRIVFHDDGIISQFEGYERAAGVRLGGLSPRSTATSSAWTACSKPKASRSTSYKASKQADVLMLFYLFSAETLAALFERLGYAFDAETIPKNIDYYLQRTSHGSTLSSVIHSWVLGAQRPRSARGSCSRGALRSDLEDVQGGTTPEGIHLGAMAGTVDLLERGYTGMELRHEALCFNPALPAQLSELKINVRYRGHSLAVLLREGLLRVTSMTVGQDPIHHRLRQRAASPGCRRNGGVRDRLTSSRGMDNAACRVRRRVCCRSSRR